jgi:hypothetical protein
MRDASIKTAGRARDLSLDLSVKLTADTARKPQLTDPLSTGHSHADSRVKSLI